MIRWLSSLSNHNVKGDSNTQGKSYDTQTGQFTQQQFKQA